MKKWYALLLVFAVAAGSAFAQQGSPLIINEFLADPPLGLEGDANGDGERHANLDEFVEMLNVTKDTLDLTGWRLGDDERVNFTFPAGYKLPPRHFVTVFGGGNVENVPGYDPDPMKTRVFAPGDSIGNGLANGGETIVLLSPDGKHDTYLSYGSRVGKGAPTTAGLDAVTFEYGIDLTVAANERSAVTRYPDGDIYSENPWVKHTDIRGTAFSPGTTVDGELVAPKVSPTPIIIINEVLANVPTGPDGDANRDGERNTNADEFVELANVSYEPVDLTGWTLGDDEIFVTFTFPDGYILPPRSLVTIFGGGNVENVPGYDPDPMKTRAFVVDSLHLGGIGNGLANGGDIVLLLSPDGKHDTYFAYGSLATGKGPAEGKYPEGVEFVHEINTASATSGGSMVRYPDGNINLEDPFVLHTSVSPDRFSPGTTLDGGFILPEAQPPVDVMINEILADATTDANGDGVVSAMQDQFIELVNVSETKPVDLSGFSVGDASGTTFTFPAGYKLAPRTFVAVFGGGDVSNVPGYNADPMLTRVFAASGMLGDGLDKDGDIAVLRSPDGTYDAYVAYGSQAEAGGPTGTTWEFSQSTAALANTGSSITRDPDANILAGDPFVVHSSVSSLPYSPAQSTAGLGGVDDFVDVPHPWGTGHALHFSWWERDRVELREAPELLPLRLPQGTIEMWFKPDSLISATTHPPDWTYLFAKNIAGNKPGDLGLGWERGEGRLQFFMQDGTGTSKVYSSENSNEMYYPRWYHVAATWSEGGQVRLFVDGELRASAPNEMALIGGTQMIAIGSGSDDLWNSRYEGFRGMIDEVRFSVVERYTESFEPLKAPFDLDQYTLALWHFDEGSGDVAYDSSPFEFNGKLGGFDAGGNPDPASAPRWVDIAEIVSVEDGELPQMYSLDQNFPNPFGQTTAIRFGVPRSGDVQLHVYNLLGQRVATLLDGTVEAGTHTVHFASDALASGVYFYVLQSAETRMVQKMLIVK